MIWSSRRQFVDLPMIQHVLALLADDEFRAAVAAQPGYDVAAMGQRRAGVGAQPGTPFFILTSQSCGDFASRCPSWLMQTCFE